MKSWEYDDYTQSKMKKSNRTTLCVGFTLRRRTAGGRIERQRKREEMKGWGGNDRGTVKQRKQRKRGEFRSVLWIMHAGLGSLIHFWFGERKTR